MRVCDFIIFEIPILTVWSATYMISTVKIEILNIIKSQSHHLHLVLVVVFSGSLFSFFEINIFLYLLVCLVFSCPLLDSVVAICPSLDSAMRDLIHGSGYTRLIVYHVNCCILSKYKLYY